MMIIMKMVIIIIIIIIIIITLNICLFLCWLNNTQVNYEASTKANLTTAKHIDTTKVDEQKVTENKKHIISLQNYVNSLTF
jgi:uncharacterized protein YpmB